VLRRIVIGWLLIGCDRPVALAEPGVSISSASDTLAPLVVTPPASASHAGTSASPAAARPCIPSEYEEVPLVLTPGQVRQALVNNNELELRNAVKMLGGPSEEPSSRSVQRIAFFQKAVQAYASGISVHGIVDPPTLRALERAVPSLHEALQPSTPPACWLRWPGSTAEQRYFMRVYDVQRWRSAQKRMPAPIPDSLAPIEDDRTAQVDAAKACRELLREARRDKPRHGNLQVAYGYRSALTQLEIWEYHFPARYRETSSQRSTFPQGPHGPQAILHLATVYASRTASPGFSLHQRGTAIDFVCTTDDGSVLKPTGRFLSSWKRSWCLRWLEQHARTFGFMPNATIDEPWHWEYHKPCEKKPCDE